MSLLQFGNLEHILSVREYELNAILRELYCPPWQLPLGQERIFDLLDRADAEEESYLSTQDSELFDPLREEALKVDREIRGLRKEKMDIQSWRIEGG